MNDTDEDRLTDDEQVMMLRIAVRVLTRFDECSLAQKVERVANGLATATFEGKAYRPGE